MTRSVEVRSYMLNHPITVTEDMSILDASRKILEHKISGVCVIDEQHRLVGVLSELDCLRAIVERMFENGEPTAGTVREAMTSTVEANGPHDQIIDVAASMLDHKHRRRPVVDNGKLVGQVTCRQLLAAIKQFAE